jgi:hypothetical protein
MAADTSVEIGARPIPQEPMVRSIHCATSNLSLISSQYIIMNLGMSPSFGAIDFAQLTFPATMRVDWIRVYQPPNAKNIGCDPRDFPTAAYINQWVSFSVAKSAVFTFGERKIYRSVHEPQFDDMVGRLSAALAKEQLPRPMLNAVLCCVLCCDVLCDSCVVLRKPFIWHTSFM